MWSESKGKKTVLKRTRKVCAVEAVRCTGGGVEDFKARDTQKKREKERKTREQETAEERFMFFPFSRPPLSYPNHLSPLKGSQGREARGQKSIRGQSSVQPTLPQVGTRRRTDGWGAGIMRGTQRRERQRKGKGKKEIQAK